MVPGAPAPSAAGTGEGEWGLLQVLSLCRVFSPLWGVFPEFRFPLPSIAVFRVWSNLVRISVPPSSPALTPAPWLDQIRDDTKSRKGRGWRPRVTLIRSGIEMSRARPLSWSPPPERVTGKIAQIAGGLHKDRYPSCNGKICFFQNRILSSSPPLTNQKDRLKPEYLCTVLSTVWIFTGYSQ